MWKEAFEGATSLADVEFIADRMTQAGIDPKTAAAWHDKYAKIVAEKDEEDAKKPYSGIYGIEYFMN